MKSEGKAKPLAQHISGMEFAIALVTVLAVFAALCLLGALSWRSIAAGVAAAVLATVWLARKFVTRIGGYTGDCLGAVQQVAGRMGLYFLTPGAIQRPSEVLYDRADSAFARIGGGTHDWPALLAGADWLHVSGVTPALGQRAADGVLTAVRAARAAGAKVSFDGNFRPKLWEAWGGDAPTILRGLMAEADLLFASHRDLQVVLGLEFPQATPQERFAAGAAAAFQAFPHLRQMAATVRVQRSVDHHVEADSSRRQRVQDRRDGTRLVGNSGQRDPRLVAVGGDPRDFVSFHIHSRKLRDDPRSRHVFERRQHAQRQILAHRKPDRARLKHFRSDARQLERCVDGLVTDGLVARIPGPGPDDPVAYRLPA